MKLPSIKKILTENFADLEWAPRLLDPLNAFIESVVQGLNNQLTISENFDGVVTRLVVDGIYPQKFQWKRTAKPTVAFIGGISPIGSATTPTDAVSLYWDYDGQGGFRVLDVPGLAATTTNKYSVTIVALTR